MREGIRLYKLGRFDEALESFRTHNVEIDEHVTLSYYLGLCYTQLKKFDEALLYLEQVVTSNQDFAQVYQSRMILGYIYAETERYRLAEFEFNRLLEDGYESAAVYCALGFTLYSQDKTPSAILNLEKALSLEPENATALNSLGFILADQGIKTSTALRYCRKALQKKPNHPPYLDSLAWVLFKMGKIPEALDHLREALRLWPNNKEIKSHYEAIQQGVRS